MTTQHEPFTAPDVATDDLPPENDPQNVPPAAVSPSNPQAPASTAAPHGGDSQFDRPAGSGSIPAVPPPPAGSTATTPQPTQGPNFNAVLHRLSERFSWDSDEAEDTQRLDFLGGLDDDVKVSLLNSGAITPEQKLHVLSTLPTDLRLSRLEQTVNG